MKKNYKWEAQINFPLLEGLVFKKIFRMVRFTIFCFFLSLFQVMAVDSYSQMTRLSLNVNNERLEIVLGTIEKKSEFFFLYNRDLIDVEQNVSIKSEKQTINSTLDELLKGTDINFFVYDRQIVLSNKEGISKIVSQQNSITGKVTDVFGQSLPGVTVVIRGTTQGTVTNVDGDYSLTNIPADAILVFSFVGMRAQEVPVNKSVINITLEEESIGIEEVVAIGYQIQRKADLTGAIEVVEMEAIINVSLSSGNPMQALQGRVPGLLVEKTGTPTGTSSRILIRGVNTLGDNNPLYIIDGVPTKRSEVFQSLSPTSIASVQVLKDASASSIYGSRASNGVIIVTTKDGSGQNGKIKVQFNTNFSVQSEKRQRFNMLDAEGRGKVLWQASINDHTDPVEGYGDIYNFDWNGDYDNPVLNSVSAQPYVGGDTNVLSGNTDWQAASYDPAYVTNNDLTISGGTKNSSILMNINYIKNSGMLKYTNYDRVSARLNGQTRMFDGKLKIGMNTQVVTSNETLDGIDLGNGNITRIAFTLAPTIPVYTSTGEYAGPLGAGYTNRNNPVHMQYLNRWDNTKRSYFYGNAFAEIQPVKNLVFRTTIGVDYSITKERDVDPTFVEGFLQRTINTLTNYRSDFMSITWSNTANYNLKLGKHRLGVLAGLEMVSNDFSDLTGYKEGFSSQEESYFVLGAGTQNANSFGTGTSSRLLSQFGKISYSNADKYLASLTLRRDGSSRFGTNNRYGIFPAATFGWRINEENFMSGMTNVSNLKLRIGAGRVGNQDIGNFASYSLYEPRYGITGRDIGNTRSFNQVMNLGTAYDLNGANSGNLPSGFVSVQAANPNLQWEQTDELNIGIDFGFLDSKIIGAFDYFTRKTSDILIQPPIASAIGEGQQQWLNGATQKNQGWEAYVNYDSDKKNDFSYSITVSASHFKDKITELPEEVRTAYPGNSEQTIIGHSQFSIFGYVTDGLFQNQEEVDAHAEQIGAGPGRIRYKDLNDDDVIDALDQKFIGTTLPDIEYGLQIDLNYKNFDLSIFSSGVAGKTDFDSYIYYNEFVKGRDNGGLDLLNAWTRQNPTSIPALTLADSNDETRTSDYFYVNASYFKLRNVQLGYDFPITITNRIGLDKLRMYLMADNLLWIKSKEYRGPDPERLGQRTGSNNVVESTIPVPTTYSVGLNVSF